MKIIALASLLKAPLVKKTLTKAKAAAVAVCAYVRANALVLSVLLLQIATLVRVEAIHAKLDHFMTAVAMSFGIIWMNTVMLVQEAVNYMIRYFPGA